MDGWDDPFEGFNWFHYDLVLNDDDHDSLELEFNQQSLSSSQLHHQLIGKITNLQRMWVANTVNSHMANFNLIYHSPHMINPLSLRGLRGHIVFAAKDHFGRRFLQRKIEQGSHEDIQLIFLEVKDHICELMIHQFGNYVMQNFFEFANEDQMTHLLYLLTRDGRKFKNICIDILGNNDVQKLLEHLTEPDQRALVVSVLRRITLALVKNNNGQHVIQQCLKCFSPEDNKHILNVVADNCLDVATDKIGCCVLQQCLTYSIGESCDRLFSKIIFNALVLSAHPYGNYVVQCVIGFRIPRVTSDIIVRLYRNYISLSMNKYESNVVEKCARNSEGDGILPIVEELILSPDFFSVLQDKYGNFVAQCIIEHTKGATQMALIELVIFYSPFLRRTPYGERVLACVERL